MESIAEYLLSVTGAAIVSAMILRLLEGKGSTVAIGRMLASLFVALTVIGPITKVRVGDVEDLFPDVSAEAEAVVAEGQATAKKALDESISSQVEAYILDKAAQFGLVLTVQVELSEDTIPVPIGVRLQGSASPYAKSRLQNMIRDDLGIDKENQLWT